MENCRGTYIIRLAKQNCYQTLSIFVNIKNSCMLMFVNNFDITYSESRNKNVHLILNGTFIMENNPFGNSYMQRK